MGQHFLADSRFRNRIADSINLLVGDLVIEIGAGRGAMTLLLARRSRRVVALELDQALVDQLRSGFGTEPRIEILHADILTVDLAEICRREAASRCFVFGNLPYYITSPILNRLRTFRRVIRAMALLVQGEVADRIVAVPGSRDYGYLSVFVQTFSRPALVFGIPPGAFSPPPKVKSALVQFQIEPRFPNWTAEAEEKFLNFVRRCFAQKRKNIINNLSAIAPRKELEEKLARLQLPATVRAEEVTLEQFAMLYTQLS